MRKITVPVKRFAVQSHLRHYKYIALCSLKTGKLLRIVADCRKWRTFEDARNHYRGLGKAGLARNWEGALVDRWADSACDQVFDYVRWVAINHCFPSTGFGTLKEMIERRACRIEARNILNALERKVKKYQGRKRRHG